MNVTEYVEAKLAELRGQAESAEDGPVKTEFEQAATRLAQNALALQGAAAADPRIASFIECAMPEALEVPISLGPVSEFLHHL